MSGRPQHDKKDKRRQRKVARMGPHLYVIWSLKDKIYTFVHIMYVYKKNVT